MITKFLDPKNDFAFKRIFGSEKNKDILIQFLNDMITFETSDPIIEVQFLKTILDPEISSQKVSLLDVLCKDTQGRQFIVEMQVASEKGFEKRAQYYAAKAYGSQAKIGSKYYDLKEVVFLAITNFVLFPLKEDYKSDHIIFDKKTYEHDLKDFSFTFLELPKFNKSIEQLASSVERWAYFFKHAEETHNDELPKIIGSHAMIAKAYNELNVASFNQKELMTYESSKMQEGHHEGVMAKKFDEGKAEGFDKGIAEGIAKGKAEGEMQKALAIAQSMHTRGIPINEIALFTDLSLDILRKNL